MASPDMILAAAATTRHVVSKVVTAAGGAITRPGKTRVATAAGGIIPLGVKAVAGVVITLLVAKVAARVDPGGTGHLGVMTGVARAAHASHKENLVLVEKIEKHLTSCVFTTFFSRSIVYISFRDPCSQQKERPTFARAIARIPSYNPGLLIRARFSMVSEILTANEAFLDLKASIARTMSTVAPARASGFFFLDEQADSLVKAIVF
nr:hypothetical protein [Candidatus Sigynarchaeum springense]